MSKPADNAAIDTGSSGVTPRVDAGITYSQTESLDGIVVRHAEPTATGLWIQLTELCSGAGLAGAIATAVRELLTGNSSTEVHTTPQPRRRRAQWGTCPRPPVFDRESD